MFLRSPVGSLVRVMRQSAAGCTSYALHASNHALPVFLCVTMNKIPIHFGYGVMWQGLI